MKSLLTGSAVLIALVVLAAAAPAETIYTWTDENGVRHMTNILPVQPPEDLETMEIEPPPITDQSGISYVKPEKPLEKETETKVNIVQDHVIVPVVISYQGKKAKANLLLDTGASKITLHDSFAKRLRIKKFENGSIRVAGGEIIDAKAIRLDAAARDQLKKMGVEVDGMFGFWDEWIETYIEGARKILGEELTMQYREEGIRLGFEKAVEYALDFDKD